MNETQNTTRTHRGPVTRMTQAVRDHGGIIKSLDAVIVRAQSLGPAMSSANHKGLQRPWTDTRGR
ncbi:MAG TPA: hypothetical protein VJ976_03535 [Ornithinimicrobium sp.]|uniref:hypothetical protein n=1 Tax=Ornithinimicrobium sp. TaxID=1977084 RepID=UPI002B47AC3E|nr:hypothetical protein [Ornithinimicrobium sp.]HKJ11443.1 hypothetical protein [Ornithinimicrobium sp.]